MKKFLASCLVALGCLTIPAAPSFAQAVTTVTTISERGYYPHRYHAPREYRPHRHRYREVCRTKTVRYYHHGRLVTKRTTVCR